MGPTHADPFTPDISAQKFWIQRASEQMDWVLHIRSLWSEHGHLGQLTLVGPVAEFELLPKMSDAITGTACMLTHTTGRSGA